AAPTKTVPGAAPTPSAKQDELATPQLIVTLPPIPPSCGIASALTPAIIGYVEPLVEVAEVAFDISPALLVQIGNAHADQLLAGKTGQFGVKTVDDQQAAITSDHAHCHGKVLI